jgi:putative NADH-flavin reductase
MAVLGASGATGRHVVARALRRGHEVVAPLRRPGLLEPAPGLREVMWTNVSHVEALTEALRDVDVVVTALGGAARGPTTVCTDAARSLIPAMDAAGVGRVIAVSAHGVLETHDRSLYSRAVWLGVGEKMKDKEAMEALLTSSDLAWTIVRPPTLTDTAPAGDYQTGERLPIRLWSSIARADLADFLVREAESPVFVRRYPRIRR